MKKENEFGNVYHQMNWSYHDLMLVRDLCLATYDAERLSHFDYCLLHIADRIEKELGIE